MLFSLLLFIATHKVEEMEIYVVLFLIIVSILFPRLASAQFSKLERAFAQLARRANTSRGLPSVSWP